MVNGNDADKINSLFYQGLAEQGIVLADESVNRLVRYSLELIKWNRKVNLVAKNTSVEDIVEKHFLDSLTLLPVLEGYSGRQASLLDVGSGAGFPGLVIKSVSPERPVTLLEPRHRRVSFLNHIIRTLQLKGIEVSSMRTEELATTSHPPYEVITGRAVADVTAFLDMVKDLAEPDTLVVCMQGASGPEQWEKEQVNKQYSRIAIERTSLPFSKAKRSILVFRTIAAASKLR